MPERKPKIEKGEKTNAEKEASDELSLTQLAPIIDLNAKGRGLIKKEKLILAQLEPLKTKSIGENEKSSAEIVIKSDENTSPALKSEKSQSIERGVSRGGGIIPPKLPLIRVKLNPKLVNLIQNAAKMKIRKAK